VAEAGAGAGTDDALVPALPPSGVLHVMDSRVLNELESHDVASNIQQPLIGGGEGVDEQASAKSR
jgi:hypothetical protein